MTGKSKAELVVKVSGIRTSTSGNAYEAKFVHNTGNEIGTSYLTRIALYGGGGGTELYAEQLYVTASGKDHWIFLLIVKKAYSGVVNGIPYSHKVGDIVSRYEACDHPSTNQRGVKDREVPHPFGSFNPKFHDVVLVDNNMLIEAKKRITSKRTLLMIITEDFVISESETPVYQPREIIQINEFPDEPMGKIVAKMKTPQWAKVVIRAEEITLEKSIIATLPPEILYRKMKLKQWHLDASNPPQGGSGVPGK